MHRSELTSDAFRYNGIYFEDVVSGYHTLNTKGRYLLDKNLKTRDSERTDGSVFRFGRYPSREIEVEYFIEASSQSDFINKYHNLCRYMNSEQAAIIFNDEDDKFLIGSITSPPEVDETQASRSGTFTILCSDPFKYSLAETILDKNSASYTAATNGGSWTLDYKGTYKAFPSFEVAFPKTVGSDGNNTETSVCGYVGFADSNGAVLQFGNSDIEDTTNQATNPFNKTFETANSTSDMTLNGSVIGSGYSQKGTVNVNTTGKYVYPNSYGSGSDTHGPSLSYIIPNTYTKQNFMFNLKHIFDAENMQFGCFQVLLYNNNAGTRTLMAGVNFEKDMRGKKTNLYFYAPDGEEQSFTGAQSVDVSLIGEITITKIKDALNFETCGKSVSFTMGPDKRVLVANEIVLYFGKAGTNYQIGINAVKECSLTQFSQDSVPDIPNLFMPGNVLKVDVSNAGVYLDDNPAQTIGALGNDWETFTLKPGNNIIAYEYSSFVTTAPEVKMKYRERFI